MIEKLESILNEVNNTTPLPTQEQEYTPILSELSAVPTEVYYVGVALLAVGFAYFLYKRSKIPRAGKNPFYKHH